MRFYRAIFLMLLIAVAFCHAVSGQNEKKELKGDYMGQDAPKLTAKIFAPGIVSMPDEYEFASVFSKDGNEFYFGVDVNGKTEIRYMLRINDKWSAPRKINFDGDYSYNDPFLSSDGNRLYFISDRPLDGSGEKKDIDIWFAKRIEGGWSEPINAGEMINSPKDEYYISFSKEGRMYFASNAETDSTNRWNFDIYSSELKDGVYQKPQKLCDRINTENYEADVFISPDESYIIFCSVRKGGYGQGDLYISFKKDGKWTRAINMGEDINTTGHELCPFVTEDGKYFFYTSNKDIYWVDTKIFDLLKLNK